MAGITSGYAERIRFAMNTGRNPTKAPITLKQLAQMTGYSYEQVRRLYNSEPVGSQTLNDIVCKVLGLDPDELWKLAQKDKVVHRLGIGFFTSLPSDKRLVTLWAQLSEIDQEKVIKVIEGLIITREAEGHHGPTG